MAHTDGPAIMRTGVGSQRISYAQVMPVRSSRKAYGMLAREQIRHWKQDDGRLVIDWADGHHSVFHYIWLRDNCLCAQCRHSNGQRLLDTAAIPAGVAPARLSRTPKQVIEIEWAAD